MKNDERDEMLIRIDQRTENLEKEIFGKPKYSTIREKVLAHDKLMWGIFFIGIGILLKDFWVGMLFT